MTTSFPRIEVNVSKVIWTVLTSVCMLVVMLVTAWATNTNATLADHAKRLEQMERYIAVQTEVNQQLKLLIETNTRQIENNQNYQKKY